ncbi:hypothetical protein AX774_g6351 [Zancudomyces culisetae]|uniref:Uncharacterized protein n=1 Tax=Zancudomyces culisetae TaxID=1213189 RepID=A0A1R1PH17_ZANCU|nr:hypothetical protein AX774_g6351 [Zancudomyces culisetae]|eukprot:OMH80219.1 hypothetical protein AX774_g6351 [Zancudomyces culisetae]
MNRFGERVPGLIAIDRQLRESYTPCAHFAFTNDAVHLLNTVSKIETYVQQSGRHSIEIVNNGIFDKLCILLSSINTKTQLINFRTFDDLITKILPIHQKHAHRDMDVRYLHQEKTTENEFGYDYNVCLLSGKRAKRKVGSSVMQDSHSSEKYKRVKRAVYFNLILDESRIKQIHARILIILILVLQNVVQFKQNIQMLPRNIKPNPVRLNHYILEMFFIPFVTHTIEAYLTDSEISRTDGTLYTLTTTALAHYIKTSNFNCPRMNLPWNTQTSNRGYDPKKTQSFLENFNNLLKLVDSQQLNQIHIGNNEFIETDLFLVLYRKFKKAGTAFFFIDEESQNLFKNQSCNVGYFSEQLNSTCSAERVESSSKPEKCQRPRSNTAPSKRTDHLTSRSPFQTPIKGNKTGASTKNKNAFTTQKAKVKPAQTPNPKSKRYSVLAKIFFGIAS